MTSLKLSPSLLSAYNLADTSSDLFLDNLKPPKIHLLTLGVIAARNLAYSSRVSSLSAMFKTFLTTSASVAIFCIFYINYTFALFIFGNSPLLFKSEQEIGVI